MLPVLDGKHPLLGADPGGDGRAQGRGPAGACPTPANGLGSVARRQVGAGRFPRDPVALRLLQLPPPAGGNSASSTPPRKAQPSAPKVRKSVSSRVHEAVKAIALCHNVTPVYESRASVAAETEYAEADRDFSDENRTYQASSPDEVSQPPMEHLTVSPCFLGLRGMSVSPHWGVHGGLVSRGRVSAPLGEEWQAAAVLSSGLRVPSQSPAADGARCRHDGPPHSALISGQIVSFAR